MQICGSAVPPDRSAVARLAGGVHEADTNIVLVARGRRGGHQVVPCDCRTGAGEPLFPLTRAGGLPIGVQQVVPAQWALTVLRLHQAQGGVVQRQFDLASPIGSPPARVSGNSGSPAPVRQSPGTCLLYTSPSPRD